MKRRKDIRKPARIHRGFLHSARSHSPIGRHKAREKKKPFIIDTPQATRNIATHTLAFSSELSGSQEALSSDRSEIFIYEIASLLTLKCSFARLERQYST